MWKNIGYKIKGIREENELSMEKFGELFDPPASKGVVSNWENDYNYPNKQRVERIAELGNMTVNELLYGEKNNKKDVGLRIRSIRKNRGMTLEDFGDLLNPPASDSIVSRWERGVSLPSNERTKQIAKEGNITVDELLYGNPLERYSDEELLKELLRRKQNN